MNPNAYCEAEDFQHGYEMEAANGSRFIKLHVNHFRRTKIGELATMRDMCLDNNGMPVRRLCEANNATATWRQLVNVTCRAGSKLSRGLNQLREEMLGEVHKPVILTKVTDLLSQALGQLAPVDVYTTAQIIVLLVDQRVNDAALSADLVNICSQLMSSDKHVLLLSAELNATNTLLNKFEDYMDALPQQFVPRESCGKTILHEGIESANVAVQIVNYANIGVQALISSNLSVFYVNPTCDNITGMAIYSATSKDRRSAGGDFWYRFLYANESVHRLRSESDLETATYLPEQLWRQLRNRGASYLVFKIYAHDALFVETSEQRIRRPGGKVLSITIPGFEGELPGALPFVLRKPEQLDAVGGCGYWNYETWLDNGITTCNDSNEWDTTVLCQAQHLTQFSFLIGGSYWQQEQQDDVQLQSHEQLLDMLTLVGCGLSLFGLLGIFLTAALVKKWRDQASTKVLLHLCLALSLQLSLFGVLSVDDWTAQISLEQDWNRCLISGAALQYSVLVIFSWMLIIAFLQFQRYVTVIGVARPQHYILISAIVAWTLPLLPTLLVVLLDDKSYKPTEYQLNSHTAMCYPSGYGLAFGVVLPIALITIVNCFMMICIVYSIYQALNPRRQLIVQQLRLSVLLFFLLGLSWIFGLCSYLHLGIIFSYLFCLTATLQGFVLFVYFVLLNTANRHAWLKLFCPNQMRMDVPRRSTELKSMTTSSTNFSRRTQS
ncbi:adhesion G-protein coupled receptor G2-like isoform X2 [Drosophila innubila]|uniref:adhesion G-protein coupled receptor G2-like isoform X2 n=1 Tax=Drosophila innubila TaxID=198719 RepID=UPI00148BA320|nr:adhesion G-protein coupled receptor G2-like isoform X2 [Drosophila innubila]